MKLVFIVLLVILCSCNNESKIPIIEVQNDYEEALKIGKTNDMSILVFFDRWSTSNTTMLKIIDKSIKEGNLNGYVVTTLLTDDKEMKEGDSISIGERNLKIERDIFETEVYPVCFILNSDGEIVNGPLEHCSNKEFLDFIEK